MDDCSTDDSWQILNKICAQNNSCFCFKNDSNRGVSYTRNCTLELAKEKYIWFIDPDDLLCPLGGGKRFFECAERERANVILGNYVRVEESFSLRFSNTYQVESIRFAKTKELILPTDDLGKEMCRPGFLVNDRLHFRENMIVQEDTLLL